MGAQWVFAGHLDMEHIGQACSWYLAPPVGLRFSALVGGLENSKSKAPSGSRDYKAWLKIGSHASP